MIFGGGKHPYLKESPFRDDFRRWKESLLGKISDQGCFGNRKVIPRDRKTIFRMLWRSKKHPKTAIPAHRDALREHCA